MLLTGNNNHVAGVGSQFGHPTMDDVPGYETHLSDRVAPMPRLLREAGYHTYITGKWHLGTAPEHGPAAVGFERSFTLLHGAGSHFSSTGFFEGGSLYREDAITPWDELSAEERRRQSRKMELYAAMVENLDRHVGTLIEYLEANGLYENTLIVFMSDNGAAPEDFFNVGPFVDYLRGH